MASTPKLSAAAEITACPLQMAGSRSALKSSNGTTPNKTRKHASSHVQLDPCPTMVIESEEVLCSPAEGCSLQRLTSTALVQSLAQAGSPGELSVDLHSMMAQLAATLLAQKPKDPEQYVVDHLLGKKLPRSQAGSTTAGVEGTPRVESSTLSISSNDDLVFNKDRREPSLSFAGPGNTVVQRLVCTELNKPSRSVLVKAAKELLSKKPDDPEHYLWTRMESRSFWDESAAANAWAQTADGEPLPPPKGLTQASLLKEVPPATPGFNTAANMVHLLFSNKPDDPIQFLVSHYGARALNSGGSMRGNSTSRRPGDGDEASSMTATSRDLLDDNDDEDSNNEEGSGPARGPSLQRKGSLGSFGTFHGGARRNSSRSGSRRHAAVSTSGAVPTSTCTSEPGGSLRQARHVNVFDPSSVEPVESLLSISQLEQLPRRERDAAVKEWELLRSREDLHRHRLQYEVQSLWLDRQFRDRMSCIDPSEATTLAAQTAAHAHAEAAQYLRQRQTRLDQLTALIEQAHGCDESNE